MPVFSVSTDKTCKMEREGEERKRIKEKEIESQTFQRGVGIPHFNGAKLFLKICLGLPWWRSG